MILRIITSNLHIENISNGATVQKIRTPQDMMARMQYVCKWHPQHIKTHNQQENMKLHEILSKFHIGHDQNGATVQQIQATQEIVIICQKQEHDIFYIPKQQAT